MIIDACPTMSLGVSQHLGSHDSSFLRVEIHSYYSYDLGELPAGLLE